MQHRSFRLGLFAACLLLMLAGCTDNHIAVTSTPAPPHGLTQTVAPAVTMTPSTTSTIAAPTSAASAPSPTSAASSATPTAVAPTVTATAAGPAASPTPVAPRATPTAAPLPSPKPAGPRIVAFTAAPTTTQRLGETITFTWQAQGGQATLCPFVLGMGGPALLTPACVAVPPVGSRTITVTQDDLAWDGMSLRVTSGAASAQSVVTLTLGCQGLYDWFFANPPARCPQDAATTSPAAAQRFERGLMIWLAQPDRFYVFYDETPQVFQWTDAPYRFNPGASPDNRVGVAPPTGLFEPVSGFGQLWRGEFQEIESLRSRLGWARAPEFSFTAHYQCARPLASGRLWTCFLAAPDGRVLTLRPDSSAQVHFLWEAR